MSCWRKNKTETLASKRSKTPSRSPSPQIQLLTLALFGNQEATNPSPRTRLEEPIPTISNTLEPELKMGNSCSYNLKHLPHQTTSQHFNQQLQEELEQEMANGQCNNNNLQPLHLDLEIFKVRKCLAFLFPGGPAAVNICHHPVIFDVLRIYSSLKSYLRMYMQPR